MALTRPKLLHQTRLWLAGVGVCLILAGLLLPTRWYATLPRISSLPPRPFSGTTLLQATFIFEGLVAIALAYTGWRPPSRRGTSGTADPGQSTSTFTRPFFHANAALVFVTVIAATLRFYRLDLDLWIDEVATVSKYASQPLAAVYGSYLSPGNHLLNSLLLKVSVNLFGETEWAVRLPAVLFGIATIPVMYWLARMAMSRAASLGAALLLAFSYHHIFFSQNARGYSAHLLFALLSTGFLVDAMRADRPRSWFCYTFSMTLGFAALMTTVFVLLGHVSAAAVELAKLSRKGSDGSRPLAIRLALAFAAAGFLAFQVYAVSIPDVLAIYPTVYATQGSGFAVFSLEFAGEMVRGISAGFLKGVTAVPFVFLAAWGFMSLLRRNASTAVALSSCLIFTVLFLTARGQSVAPRFLLLGVPLAILSGMAAIDDVADWLGRRQRLKAFTSRNLVLGLSTALAGLSLLALPAYYSTPKQPYRKAIAQLETTWKDGDRVVVAYPAITGIEYYLERDRSPISGAFVFVRTPGALDSAEARAANGRVRLVTTLFRVLRSESPAFAAQILRDWVPVTTLRGTLGDGDINIWHRRATRPHAQVRRLSSGPYL